MKKDFSQSFETTPSTAYLLAEDSKTGRFIIFQSTEDGEEDFYEVPSFRLQTGKDLTRQIAANMWERGLVVNRYRELSNETMVNFSFVDDTPGHLKETRCFWVQVDIPRDRQNGKGERLILLSLNELLSTLQLSPFVDYTVQLGIAQLLSEYNAQKATHLDGPVQSLET